VIPVFVYGLFHLRDGTVTHLSQGDAICVLIDLWIQESSISLDFPDQISKWVVQTPRDPRFCKRHKQQTASFQETAAVTFDAPAGAGVEGSSKTTLYHDMSYECIHFRSWAIEGGKATLDFPDQISKWVVQTPRDPRFCKRHKLYLVLAIYGLFHLRDGTVTHLSQGDAICVLIDLWSISYVYTLEN
jgi:hypothetical protein